MRVLVHNQMTRPIDAEVQALFPAEQARVADLLAEGSLEQLYVAADYSQAWLIARSETLTAAQVTIASLPLAPFVRSSFTPLADLA
jgi:muconolactone delta-isomerase